MQVKKRWGVVGLSLAAGAFGALGMLGGCQSDSDDGGGTAGSGNASSGNPGSGGTGAQGGSGSANGGAGGSSSSAAQSGGAGGGPQTCNSAPEHTIQELTNGTIGPDIKVTVKGVVAMSHKWLVSGPGQNNNCLYGVYVSAPGLDTTAPNTGILVVSYGNEPLTTDDGVFCAKVDGSEESGGNIPDDVKPGDVLDIPNAETTSFAPSSCASEPNGTTVKQLQLATHFSACKMVKNGTAPIPAPAVLTEADVAKLGAPSDKAFHDQWGGVFVRAPNLTPVVVTEPYVSMCDSCCASMADPPDECIVDSRGKVLVEEGFGVADKIYYRGYDKANKCHAGPVFAVGPDQVTEFDYIQGFHALDFCTWGLFAQDKCADYSPKSEDCGADTTCPYTGG